MVITLSILAGVSLTINFVMTWYIKKLLIMQEDMTSELYEEIVVFQDHIEGILSTDVFAGEPTLVKLLDDIRAFAESTENVRVKLIPSAEEKANIGD